MVDLKNDVYYNFVFDHLYDPETLDYNNFVKQEWKKKEKNDELNLVTPCNKKPKYNYDFIYDEENGELIGMECGNNPYFINPYIEHDVYNKNDKILFFCIKQLIKWLDNTNNYLVTEQQKSEFKLLIYKLFYYLFLRNKNYLDFEDNDLNNFINELTESYKNQNSLLQFINKMIVKAKESALNYKDKRFQEILKNQKI